jgi:hypothetical protein
MEIAYPRVIGSDLTGSALTGVELAWPMPRSRSGSRYSPIT